jgi:glutamine amidotransferase
MNQSMHESGTHETGARMKIAVVDYGSGNLASASRALALAAEQAGIDTTVTVTADPKLVRQANRIVLPGQGAFADCAAGLAAVPGMREAIETATAEGTPFLGICVGMQLMAERGLEHSVTSGFGWIKGDVAEMPATGLRLPQMGWNGLDFVPGSHPLLDGLAPDDHVYFVHSYALVDGTPAETIATTDYGGAIPAIVVSGNRAGTQFHVEKSQQVGIRLLSNFLLWVP